MSDGTMSARRLVQRLLQQAQSSRRGLAALIVVGVAGVPLNLLTPLPVKIVVDHVIGSQQVPWWLAAFLPPPPSPALLLGMAAVLALVTTALTHAHAMATTVLQAVVGEHLLVAFRTTLFSRALASGRLDTPGASAALLYRIEHDAPSIQHLLVTGAMPLATAVLTLAGMALVMARIDAVLALIAALVTPVLYVLAHGLGRRLRRGWFTFKHLESAARALAQDALTALPVVRAFGREAEQVQRFGERSDAAAQAQVGLARVQGALEGAAGLTLAVGTAAVLIAGAWRVQDGHLTLGELLVVMTYLAMLYDPVRTITRKLADLQSALAGAERALALLDAAPVVPERQGARPLVRATGHLALRGVDFAYAGDRPVFERVNADIPAGTCMGLVGPSGAGKTTLAGLLARLHDPTHGRIELDGVDLRDYRVADLRRQYALVPQETVLVAPTVAENIAYGRPDATLDDIVRAARLANAHGFIERLPARYDTRLGERGASLSGGERQRLALARAFLRDAPVLVLDEPTSGIDEAGEAAVIDAIVRLARGRTTILITHRTRLWSLCDAFLVIQGGQVRAGTRPPEATHLVIGRAGRRTS